jgi:hypothetical protein
MRAIFVSYRRNDSEGEAGRLFDDLVEHFGEQSVFMDVAAIEAGRDFRKAIDESVATCGVLLAIIGTNWVDAKDEAGRRRLDDPSDFVRLETASALRRDIPVIPVLVRGAKVPRADQLPDGLKDLAYRNGVELTHARWASDLQLLIKALAPVIGKGETAVTPGVGALPPTQPAAGRGSGMKWLAVGGGLVAALALGGYGAYYVKAEREKQAVEQQRRAAEDEAARRRAEAEREELARKKTELDEAASKIAADRAAAEKAEADRRRESAEAARRAAAERAEAQRRRDAEALRLAEAEKAQAEQRRESAEAARRAAAEREAAEAATRRAVAEREAEAARRAAAERDAAEKARVPVAFGTKITRVACTDLGQGKYRIETWGTANGVAESALFVGPEIPPNRGTITSGRTSCSNWTEGYRMSDGSMNNRACKRGAHEKETTLWKSSHILEWHLSEPPSNAIAVLRGANRSSATEHAALRCTR